MKPVILETPYAGDVERNLAYARYAMHDCLVNHNESPYASHLLYTQEHVLDDNIPQERELGIRAGFAWRQQSVKTVFYVDLGWSPGMMLGLDDVTGRMCLSIRRLPRKLYEDFLEKYPDNGSQLIYESPDKGKTIYERKFGETTDRKRIL